ncbi:MAG: PQQ-binding-like beta-propeller repeat protein [Pirellulales bacterium]
MLSSHVVWGRAHLAAGMIAALTVLWAVAAAAQSCVCGGIADDTIAAQVGLDREWIVQVPFDSAAWRLAHVVVGEELVVAQGGDGTVAAIRTDTRPGGARRGAVAWSQRVGGSGLLEAAGIGQRVVTVARGRDVTAIDTMTGRIAWERALSGIASAGAMPAGGWVYTPLDAGGVYRLPESRWGEAAPPPGDESSPEGPRPGEQTRPVEIASQGEVDFRPVAYGNGILWCNANGLIIALVREADFKRRIEFDLGGPASGPPVVWNNDIFVATRAGDLARITLRPDGLTATSGIARNEQAEGNGEVRYTGWHTVLEATPEGSPLVGGDTVVLSLGAWGVAAFSALTGEQLWQSPQGGRPLAITDNRVWLLDDSGFLTARDLASGGRRERFCLGCFTLPVVNALSERLILASPGGLVVSLAPRQTLPAVPPVPPQPDPPEPLDAPPPAADEI